MHNNYSDITALTDNPPIWFDEHGVPRFCSFHPDRVSNIYAVETVLLAIKCQGCGTSFHVAISSTAGVNIPAQKDNVKLLSDLIASNTIHYGDPPNTDCCAAGPSMNSIPVSVLEYWCKPYIKQPKTPDGFIRDFESLTWHRDSNFEKRIDAGW